MLHKCRQRLSYHLDEGFLNSSGGREPLPQEHTGHCFSCKSTSGSGAFHLVCIESLFLK